MSVHTITASELNEIESQFTLQNLGFQLFVEGEFTLNQVKAAINSGYMPVMRIENRWYFFDMLMNNSIYVSFQDDTYDVIDFAANSPDDIMTTASGGGGGGIS